MACRSNISASPAANSLVVGGVQAPRPVRQPLDISFRPAKFHSETLPSRRMASAAMPPSSVSVMPFQPPFSMASRAAFWPSSTMRPASRNRLMVPSSLMREALSTMSWAFTNSRSGKRRRELLVLVVGHPALGRVGRHAGLVAEPALLDAQLVVDEVLDDLDLVGAARAEVAAHVVLVHPGLAQEPVRVDDEGEEGGQALGRDDDVAAPGHERVHDEAHGADARAQVDVDVALAHPGLDVLDALV